MLRRPHRPPEAFIEIVHRAAPARVPVGTSVLCWSLRRQGAAWKVAIEKSLEKHHYGQSGRRAWIVTITTVSPVVTGTLDSELLVSTMFDIPSA